MERKYSLLAIIIGLIILVMVIYSLSQSDNLTEPDKNKPMSPTVNTSSIIKLETNLGEIQFETYPADAPETVANFIKPVSYTHLRAHETVLDLVCRLLLEKKKTTNKNNRDLPIQ